MLKIKYLIPVFISFLLSCSNPIAGYQPKEGYGQLEIYIAGLVSNRTIMPDNFGSGIKKYKVTLSGPMSFAPIEISGTSFNFNKLPLGAYTLNVSGINSSGDVIAKGSTTPEITNGNTTNSNIELRPVQDGTGKINITLDWSGAGLSANLIDSVDGSLISSDGTKTTLSITPGDFSLSYSKEVNSDFYTIIFNLKKGSQLYTSVVESIHIYDGYESAASIILDDTDFTSAPATPSNLTIEQKGLTAQLIWSDESEIETGVTIYRSEDGKNFTEIVALQANVVTYTDSPLIQGKTYTYKIIASNSFGNSSPLIGSKKIASLAEPINDPDNGIIEIYWGISDNIISTAALLANDKNNLNNSALVITEVKNPSMGSVTLNGSDIIFNASAITGSSTGSNVTFEYVIHISDQENSDTYKGTGVVTVSITNPPDIIANPDTLSIQQDAVSYILVSDLIDNDKSNNALTITGVFDPVHGTVSLNDKTITFTSTGLAFKEAGFKYTVKENLTNKTTTGVVNFNVTPLDTLEAYVYNTRKALEDKQYIYRPPIQHTIFNTWGRVSNYSFYADKTEADAAYTTDPGNNNAKYSTLWTLKTDQNGSKYIEYIDNTGVIAFVSPETDKLDDYSLETTLSSANNDDDLIGLVIAYVREGDTNYLLSVVRTNGEYIGEGYGIIIFTCSPSGITRTVIKKMDWRIMDDIGGVFKNPTFEKGKGWSRRKTRLKLIREGDIITTYTTKWDDTENYQASSKLVINLSTQTRLHKFQGRQKYGYMVVSQAQTTFSDIVFTGGVIRDSLFYVTENSNYSEVWKFNEQEIKWELLPNKSIQSELGYVREIINPDTSKKFLLKENLISIIQ